MSINLTSAVISEEQVTRFEAIVTELEALLPNVLVGLTTDERRNFGRLGSRTRVFAGHAQALVRNHPGLFPTSIDAEEFNRDLELYDNTMRMLRRLTPFFERLGDTAIAAGFDAYQQSLDVYGFAKIASPNEGVKELVKEMGEHFKRTRRASRTPAEETAA